MPSPEYVALIVITLGGFEVAVYVETHFGTGMAQDAGLKVPPALLSLNVMVPERAEGELEVSVV